MSDQNVPSTGGGDTTPTKSNNPSDASALLTPTPLRLNAKAQSFTPNLLGASPIRQSNNTSPAPAATTKGPLESAMVDTAAAASNGGAPVTTGEKKHNPQLPSPMAPQLLGLPQGISGNSNGGGMLPMMHPHPFTPHMPGFTPGSGGVPMVQPPMFVAPWFGQAPPPPPSPMFFMPPPPPSPFAFGPPPPSPFFSPPGSSVPSFHQFMVTMHQTHMKNMSEAASGNNNVAEGDAATTPPAKTQSGKKDATTVKKPLNPACGEYTPSQKPDAAAIPPVVDYTSTVFVPGRGMVPTYLLGPGHQPLLPEGDDDNGDSQEDDGEGILPSGVTPQLFDMYWKLWLQLQRTSTFAAPNGGVAAAAPGHVSTTPVASTKSAAKAAAAAANSGNTNAANGGMGTRGNSEVIGSPSISVGNATFQAYTSKEPPKFACVLVIGLPSSGKTTVSRQLVSELVEERFAWEFFSGSEHIPESNAHTRAPTWDTTKAVFDALSDKIDNLLESQKFSSKPVKGLLIDKNVKGIEDVYYLYALLKKKGVQLNGIINFDSHDDDKLARRVCKGNSGLVDSTKERFKFYRAILSRVMESTKGSNLWHSIDVNDDFQGVTKHLRSKVLGCSVMQNTKPLYICNYTERNASMVHNYVEYAQVMSRVCLHARTPKPNQFPGQVTFPPLTTAVMGDNSQIRTIRESFVARRKIDGTQYVLFHEEGSAKLYLIPRHMRAVLRIPAEGWMGVRLEATGTFLLDGELVPLQADHTKEKFLVHDVIFWAEKGETENNCKGAWKVRQDRLQSFMVNESLPFHGKRSDIVVAFQNFVPISQIARLLGPSEYASEGIILQSTLKKEHTFLWRSPEQLSVDFRLGTMHAEGTAAASGGPVEVASIIKDGFPSVEIILTFDLEVFCPKAGKYVSYDHFGGVDVTCLPKFHVPVPGSIATCYLVSNTNMEGQDRNRRNLVDRKWKFRQLRSDVPTSSFKPLVDSIVDDGYVPLSELAEWFKKNEIISPAAVKDIDEAAAARKAHLSNAGRAAAANAAAAAATPAHVFSGSTDAVLMQHYWLNVMGGGGAVPPPGTMPPFAPALPPQQHAMQRQTSNSTFDGPMSRQGSTVMSTTPPPMPTAQNRAAPSMSDRLRMKEAIQATPTTKVAHADVTIRQKSKRTAEPAANAVGSETKSRELKTREPKGTRGEPRVSGGKQQEGKKAIAAAPREPKKKAAAEGEVTVAVPSTKVVDPPAPSKPQPKKAATEKKSVVKAASETTTTTAPSTSLSAATPEPKKKKAKEEGSEKKSEDTRKNDGSDDGEEDGDSPQSKAAEKRRGRRGGRKEREKRERREKRSGIDGEAPISTTDESGAAPQQSPTPAVAVAAVATVAAE